MPVNTPDLGPGGGVNAPAGLVQNTGLASLSMSTGTLNLFTGAVKLSMATWASASGMTTGELRIVFLASGVSLMYSSGKSEYTLAASTTSLAQE